MSTELLQVLKRAEARDRQRGGPKKDIILELRRQHPADFEVSDQKPKGEILKEFIAKLESDEGQGADASGSGTGGSNTATAVSAGFPTGEVPAGWGDFVPKKTLLAATKPLLQLRQKKLVALPSAKILEELLKELQTLTEAKEAGKVGFIDYDRNNLQEMAMNSAPLPDGTSDQWVIYLYEQTLERKIANHRILVAQQRSMAQTQKAMIPSATIPAVQDLTTTTDAEGKKRRTPPSSEDESSDDLSSYLPKKKFAVRMHVETGVRSEKAGERENAGRCGARILRPTTVAAQAVTTTSSRTAPESRRVLTALTTMTNYRSSGMTMQRIFPRETMVSGRRTRR